MSRYFGFDCFTYPGKDLMQKWWPGTPLWFVGFYLAPSPSHKGNIPGTMSWMPGNNPTGPRKELENMGWGPLPFYLGKQQARSPYRGEDDPDEEISEDLEIAKKEGADDAIGKFKVPLPKFDKFLMTQSALTLAKRAKFPSGTIIFLDIEQGVSTNPEHGDKLKDKTIAYAKSWIEAIVSNGTYKPGVYCSSYAAQQIQDSVPSINVTFWVYEDYVTKSNDSDPPPPHACKFPEGDFPPSRNKGFKGKGDIWQFVRDCPGDSEILPGIRSPFAIDLLTATSRNPAQDSNVRKWWFIPFPFPRLRWPWLIVSGITAAAGAYYYSRNKR